MDYSQYREQDFLEHYFGNKGVFWDIGAHDGITFSNTRFLYERGWEGYMFEPCARVFRHLSVNCSSPRLHLFNLGIGSRLTVKTLFVHPKHTQWSSCDDWWTNPWKYQAEPEQIVIVPIEAFVGNIPKPDFLSIDTEGMDAEILESMPADFNPSLIMCEIDKLGALERINAEMNKRGYRQVWRSTGNAAYEH